MQKLRKLATDQGYQSYMVERYYLMYGVEKTFELISEFMNPPVPSIRVNTNNISAFNLKQQLEQKGYKLEEVPWCDSGFFIYQKSKFQDISKATEFNRSPGASHEYLQGYYSLQSSSSMIPPLMLDPPPGEEVLDMSAAPGSKFVQMAQMMENRGLLVGIDRSAKRVQALKANVYRCSVKNSVLISNDSRNLEKEYFQGFDKILLDAPCTGEGLIGSDPARKSSRSVGDIETLMNIQVQLLSKAVELIRPGGRIVYSTCSLAPEENENVITSVLSDRDDFKIKNPPPSFTELFDPGFTDAFDVDFIDGLQNAIRVLPLHHPTRPEGFFAVILEKI